MISVSNNSQRHSASQQGKEYDMNTEFIMVTVSFRQWR